MADTELGKGGRKGGPSAVDIYVGGRLRFYRLARGLSQSALGDKLGITFQQIQKYEKGTNRISGGRLHMAATVLGIAVSDLFEGVEGGERPMDGIKPIDLRSVDMKFMERFSRLSERPNGGRLKRVIVDLIDLHLGDDDGEKK